MKKHFLKYIIFIIIMFFVIPICAKASFGDLRYEITSVSLRDSTITFEGWAFIHRTNNYNTVTYNGTTVASGGDHKILMRAVNAKTGELIDDSAVVHVLGSDSTNYNFYCELFDRTCNKYSNGECVQLRDCNAANYAALSGAQIQNKCTNKDDGNGDSSKTGYCYYEDIKFTITFDVSEWNVSSDTEISFQIAASNDDFENKLLTQNKSAYRNYVPFLYENENYTKPEDIYIHESLIAGSKYETDYIEIDTETFSNKVAVIAKDSMLRYYNSSNDLVYFKPEYNHHVFATYPIGNYAYLCGTVNGKANNVFTLAVNKVSNYETGISSFTDQGLCKDFLGGSNGCRGSHNYAIYVDNINKSYVCPTSDTSAYVAIVRGSHVKISGSTVFQINVKNNKRCEYYDPHDDELLKCNDSKTLNSTCDELSVNTSKGKATVKIEQTGTISSVLTPDSIYAGGGFNFGVMYYNTIKWSYVGGQPNDELHAAVITEMNKKLKTYEDYVSGLNITQLKLGDKTYNTHDSSFLNKSCDSSGNFYNEGLTVSCVFSFPESILYPDGVVDYIPGGSFNINNKYYTNINYNSDYDKYKLEARIEGMDRITDNAAKNDSVDDSKPWTGDWSDTFTDCEIDLYPLFMKNNSYNFVYRPIDIKNPFPNRIPGINWYDWYNDFRNVDRLKNTYSDLEEYSVVLDNQLITEIKDYNKSQNDSGGYLNWDSIDENGVSSFVDEYVTRVGDSQ